MISRKPHVRMMVIVVGVVPLFLGILTLGLQVPVRSLLAPFSRSSLLDYSEAPFRDFASLRESFVAQVLGDPVPHVAEASHAGRTPDLFPSLKRLVVVHPLTNDDFSDAKRIPRVPYTAKTNTEAATRQNEPEDCTNAGGSVWYRYKAAHSEALIADTFGTSPSTVLGVFSGTKLSKLHSLGCSADSAGNAQVSVPAAAGTTYYFQVTGLSGGGDLVFNLTQQTTTRASVSSSGQQGPTESRYPSVSSDGRYVSFSSRAAMFDSNYERPVSCRVVVEQDTQCPANIYVRDRLSHTTTLASVSDSGEPANDPCEDSAISDSGRYVAFASSAGNLIPGTSIPDGLHIFLRDLIARKTTLVSVSYNGAPRNGDLPQISADGRYVAFTSYDSDLVSGDTNEVKDVFVYDRVTEVTSRISITSSGRQANSEPSAVSGEAGSDVNSISADGRYVVFRSSASNLVPRDTNRRTDVFVRDRVAGTTTRVSMSSAGKQANGDSVRVDRGSKSTISRDGRFVVFGSSASNLVPRDKNNGDDIFVRDLVFGVTQRVSVSSEGQEANPADRPTASPMSLPVAYYSYSMAPDGRYVTFSSEATNLAPGDTNGLRDVFLHDRVTATTTRVSLTDSGHQANGLSQHLVMSAGGRFVAWMSNASNLVPGDTNGVVDVFVHEIPRPGKALSGWY